MLGMVSGMRVLQVNHQFPPFSRQGSELHCWQLCQGLSATDEVAAFHISEGPRKRPRRIERSEYDGFAVFHGMDGGHYARLADWPNRVLRHQFQSVLEQWCPEVVHFHNYLSLGDALPTLAKQSGAVVVYTLHDFGLICPNHLLWRTDGQLCGKSHGDFFQDCCPLTLRTSRNKRPLLRPHLPPLSRWQVFAQQQANPAVKRLLQTALLIPRLLYGDPLRRSVEPKRHFFLERTRQIFADVDLFIAPSRFLLERYTACGLDQQKIVPIRYGIRAMTANRRQASPDGKLRFGFLGAFHPHKGLEVLIQAFQGLSDVASLHIHGSTFGGPVAKSYWRRVTQQRPPGIHFHGAYRNEDLEGILANLDVVVVPSLWYENSPFTIQEAFQSGTPVITSNVGGMAELVRDGIDGLHFRIGDAVDLRRCMLTLIQERSRLESMCGNLPELPTLAGQTAIIRNHYDRLLQDRRPRSSFVV